mgnify:CR=1 FL=1
MLRKSMVAQRVAAWFSLKSVAPRWQFIEVSDLVKKEHFFHFWKFPQIKSHAWLSFTTPIHFRHLYFFIQKIYFSGRTDKGKLHQKVPRDEYTLKQTQRWLIYNHMIKNNFLMKNKKWKIFRKQKKIRRFTGGISKAKLTDNFQTSRDVLV